MSSASDLSCHHQSGCFALADDQTGGLLSKICHHQNPLQLPKCLFPSSASCKHFISNLRHPILSAPAFPEGAVNPLARRSTQQMVSFGQSSGTSGCSMPVHLCLTGLEKAASFHPVFWLVLGLLAGAESSSGSTQPQRWQQLCDDSSLPRKEFYVLLMQITTTDVRWSVQTGAGFHIWKWRQSGITTAGIETKVRH